MKLIFKPFFIITVHEPSLNSNSNVPILQSAEINSKSFNHFMQDKKRKNVKNKNGKIVPNISPIEIKS